MTKNANAKVWNPYLQQDGSYSSFPASDGGGGSADFAARVAGSSVVWFHEFLDDAEVDNFRWTPGYAPGTGNDPTAAGTRADWCRRITTDSMFPNGCLEQFRGAGTNEGAYWWRPFAPIAGAGNGRGTDDPAASNSLTVRAWNPLTSGMTNNFTKGYYGDASYHSGDTFDGTGYYLQVRCKISSDRLSGSNGGKLCYLTITPFSNSNQEINTESGQITAGRNYFSMYRSGSPPLEDDSPGEGMQPGYAGSTCNFASPSDCYYLPFDQWFTLLYRVVPGLNSNSDTVVQVWCARLGETTYTKIWDQSTVDLPYEGSYPFGHNAFIASGYWNGINFSRDFYHRFAEVIFSKATIPVPDDGLSWIPAPGTIDGIALNTLSSVDPDPSRTSTYAGNEGQQAVLADWTGGAFATDYSKYGALILHGGGHAGYYGNEVYAFDLTTRQFVMCGTNYPLTSFSDNQTEGEIATNIPASSHTYNHVQYVPGSVFGNTKGAFVRLQSTSNHSTGGGGSGRSHAFDFDDNTWDRFSTNYNASASGGGGEAWTCWDSTRNCGWAIGQGGNGLWQGTLSGGLLTWAKAGTLNSTAFSSDAVMVHIPHLDVLVMYRAAVVRVIDLNGNLNSAPTSVTTSGTAPNTTACGFEWCPPLGVVALWKSGMTVYMLKPPTSSPLSSTWVWTSETLTGDTPTTPTNGPYSKWKWAPSVNCFVYVGSRTGDVYAFRLTGT